MADILTVAFNAADLPTFDEWRNKFASYGPLVSIEHDVDLANHSGWIRCRYGKKKAGFEYYIGPTELEPFTGAAAEQAAKFDSMVGLTLRDGLQGLITASLAAASLAELTGGIVIDIDGDVAIPSADINAWISEEVSSIEKEIRREKERKKLIKKLQASQEAAREELENRLSMVVGASRREGHISFDSLYLKFSAENSNISIKIQLWEWGRNGKPEYNQDVFRETKRKEQVDEFTTHFYHEMNDEMRLIERETEPFLVKSCTLIEGLNLHIVFENESYFKVTSSDWFDWSLTWSGGTTIHVKNGRLAVY